MTNTRTKSSSNKKEKSPNEITSKVKITKQERDTIKEYNEKYRDFMPSFTIYFN